MIRMCGKGASMREALLTCRNEVSAAPSPASDDFVVRNRNKVATRFEEPEIRARHKRRRTSDDFVAVPAPIER